VILEKLQRNRADELQVLGFIHDPFLVVRKPWTIFCAGLTKDRKKKNITVVSDSGAAQVRVAESEERGIRAVISCACIPACNLCVRAELNRGERDCRSRKGLAMAGEHFDS